jgi:hypothetical protein
MKILPIDLDRCVGCQNREFTGKSAGCPALPACGRQVGGEGGNGLPQWSQSRPCNHIYITRKLRPVSEEFHFTGSIGEQSSPHPQVVV